MAVFQGNKIIFLCVFVLFQVSCQNSSHQSEEAFLVLDGDTNGVMSFDEQTYITGSVSQNVTEVIAKVDSEVEAVVVPDPYGSFEIEVTFNKWTYSGKLVVEGKKGDKVITSRTVNYNVLSNIERSPKQDPTPETSDVSFPDQTTSTSTNSILSTPTEALDPTRIDPSGASNKNFDLPKPENTGLGKKLSLWATYYYLPIVKATSSGFSLRNSQGTALGAKLSRKDWCNTALQGTAVVKELDGSHNTYSYGGRTSSHQVDCSAFYSNTPSHKVKFVKTSGVQHGAGALGYGVVPFRTIAVDRTHIPYNSAVYIPAARGHELTLADGSKIVHDGYFFAADTGSKIKTNHIDVYTGLSENTFEFVKSNSRGTFEAYIVEDPKIKAWLLSVHKD